MSENGTSTTPPTNPPPPAAGTTPPGAGSPPAAGATSALGGAATEDKGGAGGGTKDGTGGETKPPAESPKVLELKLPEGFKADTAAIDGFKKLAVESGLDSAMAQKVFDHYVQMEAARSKMADEAFSKQDAAWAAELQADPDIGGSKWEASKVELRKALNFAGGKPVADVLEAAGLGNHPALVKAFVKVGRALRDDTVAGSATPAAEKASEEARLRSKYPSMFPKE